MGFITSPSPSNTTEGREGGRQRGGKGQAFFSASNVHTLSTSPYRSPWQQRLEMSLRSILRNRKSVLLPEWPDEPSWL